jgi:hypothetical protein
LCFTKHAVGLSSCGPGLVNALPCSRVFVSSMATANRPWCWQVYHAIEAGEFGPYEEFEPILYSLREGRDYYLLAHDWASYLDAQV